VPILLSVSLIVAYQVSVRFFLILLLYLAVTLTYSYVLKRLMLLDVITLAGLYSVRMYAGEAVVGVPISEWTLGYASFGFLSLALAKRYSELLAVEHKKQGEVRGRGYAQEDLPIVAIMGICSGYLAVLMLALYIQSSDVRLLYRTPEWLWCICAIHVYWVGRLWMWANRGNLDDDPIVFCLKDKLSYVAGLLAAFAFALAL
jgi:4-hydroxybenzoate polyprenyltransferase